MKRYEITFKAEHITMHGVINAGSESEAVNAARTFWGVNSAGQWVVEAQS